MQPKHLNTSPPYSTDPKDQICADLDNLRMLLFLCEEAYGQSGLCADDWVTAKIYALEAAIEAVLYKCYQTVGALELRESAS